MDFNIECEQEEDGRWLAEVVEIPGVIAQKAMVKTEALALRVIAERLRS